MRKILILSVVPLLFAAGCVSSAKYDLAVKELDDRTRERDAMTKNVETVQKLNKDQATEIDSLKRENQDLLGKVSELTFKAERAEQLERATQTYQDLTRKLEKEIQAGQVKITEMKNRLTMTMVDKIIFPSGSAEISSDGKAVLGKVVEILKDIKDKRIQVEGHTDNVPIVSSLKRRFPTNWELSTERATQVVRYLQETGGLDPQVLSATGYSQYQPVASNGSDEGRQQNRRIEIVLLPLFK